MVTASAISPTRHSRYFTHAKDRQPPDIRAVFKELRKRSRKPSFARSSSNDLRAIMASASREYSDTGPADDLVRYLYNEGVLLDDPAAKEVLFDEIRTDLVLQCLEKCVASPLPSSDVPTRCAQIRLRMAEAANESREGEPLKEAPAAAPRMAYAVQPVLSEEAIARMPLAELRQHLGHLVREQAKAEAEASEAQQRAAAAARKVAAAKLRLSDERASLEAKAAAKRAEAERLLEAAAAAQQEEARIRKEAEELG